MEGLRTKSPGVLAALARDAELKRDWETAATCWGHAADLADDKRAESDYRLREERAKDMQQWEKKNCPTRSKPENGE